MGVNVIESIKNSEEFKHFCLLVESHTGVRALEITEKWRGNTLIALMVQGYIYLVK